MDDISTRHAADTLTRMIKSADKEGIDIGYAPKLMIGGEFGLAFRSIYFAAKANPNYFALWQSEIEVLNQHFSLEPYMVSHCGFPLS